MNREIVRGATGRGVRIGLIDTGVNSLHPSFGGSLTNHYDVLDLEGDLAVRRRPRGIDYEDHGTPCAGILHELAPAAEIHSLCVLGRERDRLGERLTLALDFAAVRGWEVINISLGMREEYPALHTAVRRAADQGQVLIAAKDNHPAHTGFPAAWPEVLGVDMEAWTDPFAFDFDPECEVEVLARGIYVRAPQAGGGHGLFTGASFAAPHLSAFAACLRERTPEMDGTGLRHQLATMARSTVQSSTREDRDPV